MTVLMVILGLGYAILCVWLVLLVLIQPGKAGGMGSLGGGSASAAISETLGASQAEKSLSKWTAWSAGAFFVLAVGLTVLATMREKQSTQLDLSSGAPAVTQQPAEAAPAEQPAPGNQ